MTTLATVSVARHIEHELQDACAQWEEARLCLSRPDDSDESCFVELSGLSQRTRVLVRLLGEEHAETVAVAMEAVCTLIVSGRLPCSPVLKKQLAPGMDSLLCTLRRRLGKNGSRETQREKHALVQAAHILLHDLDIPLQNAYGGFCVAFPVDCITPGVASLHARGFDLLRLEKEGLSLYVLEFPRQAIFLRCAGLGGVFASLAQSGHVFDVRQDVGPGVPDDPESVVRLLYGSVLEPDFVEALTGLSSEKIFPVNPAQVRRYRPSWKRAQQSTASAPRRNSPAQELDMLVQEYDRALKELFRTCKSADGTPPTALDRMARAYEESNVF